MIVFRVIRAFLVLIGFTVVLLAGLGGWGLYVATPKLPSNFVLDYTLNGTPADKPAAASWVQAFLPVEPRLLEVTSKIADAADDTRVQALVVRLGEGEYDWANVQELRGAIEAFKASGKKAYVFAAGYGDLYPGMAEYYLATAFDEIWLQPVGNVTITGFQAESPYFKGLLNKVGVNMQMFQKGTYKTAPEPMLRENMSAAQKQTLQSILSSKMLDFFEAVTAGRGIDKLQIGMLIDGAPYTADEALARKLVDKVGYVDELLQTVQGAYKEAEALVDIENYVWSDKFSKRSKNNKNAKLVALLHVNGLIVSGAAGGGLLSEGVAAANALAEQVESAANNEAVGAIVLRVNSPGGSPQASETLRRAVQVARENGKYVVVSMGSVAASGGYWISVDANRIFALPGTLTGSIGVYGGKADLSGLWKHLHVNWEGVKLGGNAGMWSANTPYDADGLLATERMIDVVYDQFIERVAKGRGFAPEVIEKSAQGRVWTGRQARERGLIDALGDYHAALDDIAREFGVAGRHELEVYEDLPQDNPLKAFGSFFAGARAWVSPLLSLYVQIKNPANGLVYSPL